MPRAVRSSRISTSADLTAQSAARITLATVKVSIVPSAPRFASGCAPSSALTTAGSIRPSSTASSRFSSKPALTLSIAAFTCASSPVITSSNFPGQMAAPK